MGSRLRTSSLGVSTNTLGGPVEVGGSLAFALASANSNLTSPPGLPRCVHLSARSSGREEKSESNRCGGCCDLVPPTASSCVGRHTLDPCHCGESSVGLTGMGQSSQDNRCDHCLFCLSLRNMLTLLLFIARAFISGGFQAAYVYTPEVGGSIWWGLGRGWAPSPH